MHHKNDVYKRRRVDPKKIAQFEAKETDAFMKEENETMMNTIEEFADYQEINDQDYVVVYEPSLSGDSVEETPKIDEPSNTVELPTKSDEPEKVKRKSKTLTFREKYDVIMQVENGVSVPQVCDAYGIGRTTVYDYMRRRHEIVDFIEKSNDADRRTFKKSKYPEVEREVIDWCNRRESYTKQEFFEFAKLAFDFARDSADGPTPSGFCGSWSWAKRFFHRHPRLKEKLLSTSGLPIDPKELSMSNAEYLDENAETKAEEVQMRSSKIKFLNLDEKLQVLQEIDLGKSVADIAKKFEVSKSTIYDIFKRRNDIRGTILTDINFLRKVWKMPRYPQLELELLRWCMKQQKFPLSNVLIANKALCIFETLELTGTFNPSSAWAKKFVQRHPELYEKQSLKAEERVSEEVNRENFVDEQHVIESEEVGDTERYFELVDSDNEAYDEEDYIVEEIEIPHEEELEVSPVKADNPEKISKIFRPDEMNVGLIPEQIALKSLRILIKFTEQQGHEHMLSHLIDYQAQLLENAS